MKETTALIDGDSLIYFEMGKPTLEQALAGIDQRINQMLAETNAIKYAGFLTAGKCFRYKAAITRPYKGNRKYGDKPIIFPAIREYLRQHWNFISVPELEADDLVSVYHNPEETVICSPDKDVLYQNIGVHYNYGKAEKVVMDKIDSIHFLWKQMLMGDSTDGIQGIPKVGAKTADAWLQSPNSDQMPAFVFEKYIEKFGIHEGISKFGETFQLIYILKTKEEVTRATGIELPDLITHNIEQKEDDLWQ